MLSGYCYSSVLSQNLDTTLEVPASCQADGLPSLVNIETSMNSNVSVPLSFTLKCNMDDTVSLTISSDKSDNNGFYLTHKSGDILRYRLLIAGAPVTPMQQISITPNQPYTTVLSFPPVSMKNFAGTYTGVLNFNFTY